MTLQILTDCAADLFPQERDDLAIAEAPLYIQFPDGEVDARAITPDEFYDRLEAMYPDIPSTAQPSAGLFQRLYEQLAAQVDEIMSLHISSGLSGTLNAARNGAAALQEHVVTLWDTMTLSGGQRFQVLAAALGARAGWPLDAIQERLALIREQTEVIYTLETLEYLARGGRIGRVQALAGSLLKIKPVIHVDKADGKYSTLGKNRTIKRNLDFIVSYLQQTYGDAPLWAMVLHGRFHSAANDLAQKLEENLNLARLEIGRISPVLGVHTGPGIVGVAVTPMSLFADLPSD